MGKMLKYLLFVVVYIAIGFAFAFMNDLEKATFMWGVLGWPVLLVKMLVTKLW